MHAGSITPGHHLRTGQSVTGVWDDLNPSWLPYWLGSMWYKSRGESLPIHHRLSPSNSRSHRTYIPCRSNWKWRENGGKMAPLFANSIAHMTTLAIAPSFGNCMYMFEFAVRASSVGCLWVGRAVCDTSYYEFPCHAPKSVNRAFRSDLSLFYN